MSNRGYALRSVAVLVAVLASGPFALRALSQDAPPDSQHGMNQQAQKNFEKADKAMNAAYRKLLPTLDANRQKKLKAAQRAWIAYRDADAAFVASEAEGGSMSPMLYSGAATERTKDRTEQLQGYGFAKSGISSE